MAKLEATLPACPSRRSGVSKHDRDVLLHEQDADASARNQPRMSNPWTAIGASLSDGSSIISVSFGAKSWTGSKRAATSTWSLRRANEVRGIVCRRGRGELWTAAAGIGAIGKSATLVGPGRMAVSCGLSTSLIIGARARDELLVRR